MGKIKKVERFNLPETNSSSSHSVVINRASIEYSSDIDLDEDGDIVLESGRGFGWEWKAMNSVKDKLLYVCGIYYFINSNWEEKSYARKYIDVHKKLSALSRLVCKFTGANGIKFTWIDSSNDDDGHPEIDHESSGIFDSIVGSKDSLKNFLFNKKSWLFTGNDNSDEREGFYDPAFDNSNRVSAEVTLDYGGTIGSVQFNVPEYPADLLEGFYSEYSYLSGSQFSCEIASSIVFENGTARAMTQEDKKILTSAYKNDSVYFLIDLREQLREYSIDVIKSEWLGRAKKFEDYPCLFYATKDFAEGLMNLGMKIGNSYQSRVYGSEAIEYIEKNYDKMIKVGLNIKVNEK